MCLTETATVVAHAEGMTLVRQGGRERSLQNLLVPDVRPGDRVVVGMGLVLARAAPDEPAAIDDVASLEPATPRKVTPEAVDA